MRGVREHKKKNDRMSEIQAGLRYPGLDRIIDVSQAAG
jgi:hypothetical protein